MFMDKLSDYYGVGGPANIPHPADAPEQTYAMKVQSGFALTQKQWTSVGFNDVITGRDTLSDVMREFMMNGSDSPYDPDDESLWSGQPADLTGLGPSRAFLRRSSMPGLAHSPVQKQSCPQSLWFAPTNPNVESNATWQQAETPVVSDITPVPAFDTSVLTMDQLQVLKSLPKTVVYTILKAFEQGRSEKRGKAKRFINTHCRFCKNNGEYEMNYRSHTIRDALDRVSCPVLRALVCKRCGASGDRAHTIRYCPFVSEKERFTSKAVRNAIQMSTVSRRNYIAEEQCAVFGKPSSFSQNDSFYTKYAPAPAPLDPLWANLEKTLLSNSV